MGGSAVPTELGTKPIGALIKQYAVPGIIAMTASSLYNMVDSIYIGHIPDVGSLSIAGLAITFPLMNISTAFGTLVGVGASTMISVLLGQKNYLHHDGHFAGLIEHLEGVHGGAETSILTLEGNLKSTDVLQTLDGYLGTGSNLFVKLDRLLNTLDRKPGKKDDKGCQGALNCDFD